MTNTELRIGNFIDRNGLMEVKSIHPMHLKIYDHVNKCKFTHAFFVSTFKPIPLTEEWLLKFGFKKCTVLGLYDDSFLMNNVLKSDLYFRRSYQGGYYWGFITESTLIGSKPKEHEFYDAKPVEYVHQLQNLYFALTGEELTIK